MSKIILFKLFGIRNAEFNLQNNSSEAFVDAFSKEEVQDFFNWYLSKPFKGNKIFVIFDYLKKAIDKKVMTANEVERMLFESKYISTLPIDMLITLMREHGELLSLLPKFTDFIIDKIDSENKNALGNIFNKKRFNKYLTDKIADKLIMHPIDDLIELPGLHYRKHEILSAKIVESGRFSLEGIKKYITESRVSISVAVDLFGILYLKKENEEDKNKVISTFISCVQEVADINSENNQLIMCETKHVIKGYEYFAMEIRANQKYTAEMKEKIAIKLLTSHNYLFMLYWLNYVESSRNCDMIDTLVNTSVNMAIKTLLFVPASLIKYTIEKIFSKGKNYLAEVINTMLANISNCPIDILDIVLSATFAYYPDFTIAHKDALALIKAGSVITASLFKTHVFSSEERLDILNTFMDNGERDLVAVYSAYLISGDTSKIVTSSSIDINLELLRSKKRPKDVK